MIGPYGHFDAQRGVVSALADTTTDCRLRDRPGRRIDVVAEAQVLLVRLDHEGWDEAEGWSPIGSITR